MGGRRLLIYCPRGETRLFYRPRHAAPSLAMRLVCWLSLALVSAHRALGYDDPARHRRTPARAQSQWPLLGNAYLATSGIPNPYYRVFVAGQGRDAIWHG